MQTQASNDPEIAELLKPIGLSLDSYVLLVAIAIIGFALADFIFFPIYYKNGKSIVMSSLFMILGFIVYLGVFSVAIPMVIGMDKVNATPLWIQFLILLGAVIISFLVHILVYKISAKRLEKVDF